MNSQPNKSLSCVSWFVGYIASCALKSAAKTWFAPGVEVILLKEAKDQKVILGLGLQLPGRVLTQHA